MQCSQKVLNPSLAPPSIRVSPPPSHTIRIPALVSVEFAIPTDEAGAEFVGYYEEPDRQIRVPVQFESVSPNTTRVDARIFDQGRFRLFLAVALVGCVCFMTAPQLQLPRLELKAVGQPRESEMICAADDLLLGRWTGGGRHWEPAGCSAPTPGKNETRQCIRNTTVLMIGDSAMEEKAILLLALAGYWTSDSTLAPWQRATHCKECYVGRHTDTGFDLDHGARVAFVWNGHPSECGNWGGVDSTRSERAAAQISRIVDEKGDSRLVIVFNSGLHDIYSPLFSPHVYLMALSATLDWLTGFISPVRGDLLVIKTTSSHLGAFECSHGPAARYGESGPRIINQFLREQAKKRGAVLWDEYAMLSALEGTDYGGDGHHCLSRYKPVNPVCPGVKYNASLASHETCKEVVSLLVRAICI